MFCLIGCYSISYTPTDLVIMAIFGMLGYLMKKFEYDGAPLVMAFVIGPMFENALRQSLMLSQGKFSIFVTRPISLGLLIAVFMILVFTLITKKRPTEGLKEE
jgi:putative tricarboxylic transport membrane protein